MSLSWQMVSENVRKSGLHCASHVFGLKSTVIKARAEVDAKVKANAVLVVVLV